MNINIKRINITHVISDADYVEKKIASLEKFIPTGSSVGADVELSKTTSHHRVGDVFKASVNIYGAGIQAHAEAEEATLFAAIDKVRDEIAAILKKGQSKKTTLIRRGAGKVKDMLKGFWWKK